MLPISSAVSHYRVLFIVCQGINSSLLPLAREWGWSCASFCLVLTQLFILLPLVSGALWVFCCKPWCLLAVLVSSLALSSYSSVILLWLFHLVSTSVYVVVIVFSFDILPWWVYALKHKSTKQACFCAHSEAEVSTYFQSLIFNWEIILLFQIFIINITDIHCTKWWNI